MGIVRGARDWLCGFERVLANFLGPRNRRVSAVVDRYAIGHMRALLGRPGCPICGGLAEAMARSTFWFLYEGCYEAVWISRLCAAGGFCPSHFWALARTSGTWQLTYITQYLIDATLVLLRAELLSRRRRPKLARDECPSCAQLAWWEWSLMRDLVIALRNPEVRTAYAGADGLCARHLRQLLTSGVDGRQRTHRNGMPGPVALPPQLRCLAELVPTTLAQDQCSMCAAELAARITTIRQWTEASGGASSTWLPWGDLCAPHEAWLMARGLADPRVAFHAGPAALQIEPVVCRARQLWSCGRPMAVACPLCELEGLVAERTGEQLVCRLALSDAREAYARGTGLCVRHYARVVPQAPPELQRFLADLLQRQLVPLQAELPEFFRKAEYRYRHEPRGAEQTAWQRAITQLVGGPDLALTVLESKCSMGVR